MATDVRPTVRQAATARPRLAVSRRWRRALLVTHIVSGGAWIGVDLVVAALVLTGWFAADVQLRSLAYRSLAHFVVAPMLGSALVCLASGLLLGLVTKYGLLRYWWVAVKLALNLVLCTLIVVVLAPGMPDVDRYGASLLTGSVPGVRIASMFFPPAVSLTTLTVAVVLAVAKPWGRIRKGAR